MELHVSLTQAELDEFAQKFEEGAKLAIESANTSIHKAKAELGEFADDVMNGMCGLWWFFSGLFLGYSMVVKEQRKVLTTFDQFKKVGMGVLVGSGLFGLCMVLPRGVAKALVSPCIMFYGFTRIQSQDQR